jgi:hypothetical protein
MSAEAGASADLSAEASAKAEALAKAGMNEMSDKFNAMGRRFTSPPIRCKELKKCRTPARSTPSAAHDANNAGLAKGLPPRLLRDHNPFIDAYYRGVNI